MSSRPPQVSSPLPPYETILEQEVAQARQELSRPAAGLFLSGLLAGFGVSIGVLLIAALLSMESPGVPALAMEIVVSLA